MRKWPLILYFANIVFYCSGQLAVTHNIPPDVLAQFKGICPGVTDVWWFTDMKENKEEAFSEYYADFVSDTDYGNINFLYNPSDSSVSLNGKDLHSSTM